MEFVSGPAPLDHHIDLLRRLAARVPGPPFEASMVDRPSPAILGDLSSAAEVNLVTLSYGDLFDRDGPTVLVATPYGNHGIDVADLLRSEVRRWTDVPGPVEVDGRTTVTIDGGPRPATVLVQGDVTAVVPDGPAPPIVLVRGIDPAGLELVPCRDLEAYIDARQAYLEDLGRRYRGGRGPRPPR